MEIKRSLTLAITAKAKQMKEQGIDVISLAAGEPDFDTTEAVKKAAIDAVNENFNKYTPESGIPALKEAIARKLERENKVKYSAENIIVTNGGKQALYNTMLALDRGEIIIPKPYWLTYPEQANIAGQTPVFCETENSQIKADLIADKITGQTKAIIINSPNNPTGAVIPKAELQRIADLALSKNVKIISDEVYEYFVYDTEQHSIASLGEEIKANTIITNSISKSAAVPGWRIGYAAADKELVAKMGAIQSHTTSAPCSITQKAAIKAIDEKPSADKIQEYKKRRDYMVDKLNTMGFHCEKPQGAFYCWAKIGQDSLTFCTELLEKGHVAIIPGEPFGMKEYVRLSYAVPFLNIKKAMERISQHISNTND